MSESPRLRRARPGDAAALEAFDIGVGSSPWLDEVREIVSGLLSWREDPPAAGLEREVVVLELHGEIVGVRAHEVVTNEIGRARPGHSLRRRESNPGYRALQALLGGHIVHQDLTAREGSRAAMADDISLSTI